jgi:hypothetical protein
MTPLLSRMDIGNMELDERDLNPEQGIPNGDGGVRPTPRVQHDSIRPIRSGLLNPVDYRAFPIALLSTTLISPLLSPQLYGLMFSRRKKRRFTSERSPRGRSGRRLAFCPSLPRPPGFHDRRCVVRGCRAGSGWGR